MASSPGPAHAHDPPASDTYYYPDDVFPQNSPLMTPCIPKFEPSPSPPAIPHVVSCSPKFGAKRSNSRHKVDATRGDAVLIQYMDGGRRPEISQEAGSRPLGQSTSDDDGQSCDESESTMGDESDDGAVLRTNGLSSISNFVKAVAVQSSSRSASGTTSFSLRSLAENALAAAKAAETTNADLQSHSPDKTGGGGGIAIPKRPVLALPLQYHRSPEIYSPRQSASQVLMAPNSSRSPTSLTGGRNDLARIQMASPNREKLPPIRSQLPLLEHLVHSSPKDLAVRPNHQYPHSPSAGSSRFGAIAGGHTPPPISPSERYLSSIPSPAKTLPAISPLSTMSMSSTQSPPGLEYGCSGTKSDRSSIIQTATPPTDAIVNTMSIGNVTNPPVGQYSCKFKGCSAQPFQTQYLLNSHANVHSTARPHYCPVKGCPRSEGGQGFKRKNEMIRHGLVHDSPGYVCPFCPDREHRYPRPDNLQRHVRVHHAEKDREDPALREVLAHRRDGPNRGRRRRGVP